MIDSSPVNSNEVAASAPAWGRGGRRPGAGRKPGPVVMFACEACGGVQQKRHLAQRFCSKRCSAPVVVWRGPRGGVSQVDQVCRQCLTSFRKPRRQHFCSTVCSEAWTRDTMSNPHAEETLRERRRRASARRRALCLTGVAVEGRWRRLCERDDWICWRCHGRIDQSLTCPNPEAGTGDHVIPVALGGTDSDDNLKAAHLRCNSAAGMSVRRQRAGSQDQGRA